MDHKIGACSNSNNEVVPVKALNKSKDPEYSQITISEFLNFLKMAYQVQDSVEGALVAGGMGEAVNWLRSKENELGKKNKSQCCQTSDTLLPKPSPEDINGICRKTSLIMNNSDILKKKLQEVLSEGLLDSVLPYLIQNAAPLKKNSFNNATKATEKPSNSALPVPNDKVSRRKSTEVCQKLQVKTESEVEIHVCDEVKNTKKTFICNQQLLVEKMGYFAEVTLGQNLEDMDISVHCDIGIFEWLMQWVKKDSLPDEAFPKLDAQCVIPILVSASFLQMEPLLHDCLLFCHEHMNEILRTSTNLSCLNDSVLTRLADMYTNTEIEMIKDRKDKIQSRLFSKLIQSLAEPDPASVRGHWWSIARIFKCEKCQLIINPEVAPKIPCVPSCMRLQPDGSVISLHVRDSSWQLNDYIVKLQKLLKTWRKVYWRLWGEGHFLFCNACKRYFPVNQIGWCRYHTDNPQFFTLDAQKAPLPIGRYPCCGERAYRFQLLESYSGCQFRQHTVATQDVRHAAVLSMLETYRHLIEEEPPQLLFPDRLTRLVARDPNSSDKKFVCKESFWWDGFEIIPPRPKMGLLAPFSNRALSAECESLISEDSTEEFTEEESASLSVSTTSLGSDEEDTESITAKRKASRFT
ncbi:SANT and BTB domain regulator of class switch recombination isoform X2 [Cylas formicarius]|uniref:SANT and BTB domain regulator of class switch recombination isoform X2 n=1 Tax=Cylas formicarius TaxID=197179 RepID=UPI002958BCC0|nr:SANT and BTB domain regulator of class switch recombination isoform X2 [Cylas formicarius]